VNYERISRSYDGPFKHAMWVSLKHDRRDGIAGVVAYGTDYTEGTAM